MRIVIVSTFYSEGMGYSENCLPKALASLGHEVHLVTSNLNIYGNLEIYKKTYEQYLGPADQGVGKFIVDGYTVHRLPSRIVFSYVYTKKLFAKIKEISPDIVHSIAIESIQTIIVAAIKPFFNFRLFAETHQHFSIIKTFLKDNKAHLIKNIWYKLTRTFPIYLSSLAVEKCYAISPDCAEVANIYYGVPKQKLVLQSLGTDTDLFHPAVLNIDIQKRKDLRKSLGYTENNIVCIYTGRFSEDKNPLLLAKALKLLFLSSSNFHGIFIGDGIQAEKIKNYPNVKIIPFLSHDKLAEYYRIADLAVWPTQESMSMLDAAASGLPLIVSDTIGDYERIRGNGKVFKEGDVQDLCNVIKSFSVLSERMKYGQFGSSKMVNEYSWIKIASNFEKDYYSSIKM